MASTRMRLSTSVQVYHRVAAANDMGAHDIGTNDPAVSGLGGSGDFEVHGSSDADYVTNHRVQGTTEAPIAGAGDIEDFIFIKNTGYTTSTKATATTSDLTVGIGGTFANGGFTLSSGESIALHGMGDGSDALSEINIDSSSGDIYVEVVYGVN